VIGLDGIDARAASLQHAGVAALNWAKFKHMTAGERTEAFHRPNDSPIVVGIKTTGF